MTPDQTPKDSARRTSRPRPSASELAQAFLKRRYAFPGNTDADKYQTAVKEARQLARAVLREMSA